MALALLSACTSGSETAGSAAPATGAAGSAAPATGALGTPTPGGGQRTGSDDSADSVLRGERQVVIVPVPSFESVLALDAKRRLVATDGPTEDGLFVLFPAGGGRHQIKTAKPFAGDEPSCMRVAQSNPSPLTVVAAACDTGAPDQLFTIDRQVAVDSAGRPTYTIAGRGEVYVRLTRDGQVIAEELGDAGPPTTFAFVDNGPNTLPELGD